MFILYKMFNCINKQFGLLPKVSSVTPNISYKNTTVNEKYMYGIDSFQIKITSIRFIPTQYLQNLHDFFGLLPKVKTATLNNQL